MNKHRTSGNNEGEHRTEHSMGEALGFKDEITSDARTARENVTTVEGHNTDNAILSGYLDKLEDKQYGTGWREAANVLETGANLAHYPTDERHAMMESVIHTFQGMDFDSEVHRDELAAGLSKGLMEPIYDIRVTADSTPAGIGQAENYADLPTMNAEEILLHHSDQMKAAILEGNVDYAHRIADQAIDWNETEFWKEQKLTFATISNFTQHPNLQDHLITRCNEENWSMALNLSGRSAEEGYNEAAIYAAAYTRDLLLDAIQKRDNARFEEVMEFITNEGLSADHKAGNADSSKFPPIESHGDIEREIDFATQFIQKAEAGEVRINHHVLEIVNRGRNDLINDRRSLEDYGGITEAMNPVDTGSRTSPWDRALNQARQAHTETFQEATFTARAIRFLAGA